MNLGKAAYILASLFLLVQLAGARQQLFVPTSATPYAQYGVFNGTTYLNTGTRGLPTIANARSVFAWVYYMGDGTIYSYGLNSNNEIATLSVVNGDLAFIGLSNNAQSSLSVAKPGWNLVGYSYQANSTSITFYLDNQSQTVPLSAGIPLATSGFLQSSIGKNSNCNSPCNNFFGYLANIRVYNTFMTENAVNTIYLAGLSPSASVMPQNLVSWWPLNGTSLDYSGDGNSGAYYHLAYASYSPYKLLSILITPGGYATSSTQNVLFTTGANVTVKAFPYSGYSFKNWTCAGTGCYSGTSSNATISVNGNITETANFGPASYTLAVSASPTAGGRVFINGNASIRNITSFSLRVPYAETPRLYESPSFGYVFKNWTCAGTGCYSGSNPNPTVSMYNNVTEVANFVRTSQHATVTVLASPTAGGTTAGSGSYLIGSSVNLFANPNAGYAFVNWTCAGTGCYSGTNAYQAGVQVYGNMTETANFKAVPITTTPAVTAPSSPSSTTSYLLAVIIIILLILAWLMLGRKHKRHARPHRKTKKASHTTGLTATGASPASRRRTRRARKAPPTAPPSPEAEPAPGSEGNENPP